MIFASPVQRVKNERLRDENKALQDENVKLRELVRSYESLTAALCNERDCTGCPFDSTAHVLCEHMRLAACMGELGIEVNE